MNIHKSPAILEQKGREKVTHFAMTHFAQKHFFFYVFSDSQFKVSSRMFPKKRPKSSSAVRPNHNWQHPVERNSLQWLDLCAGPFKVMGIMELGGPPDGKPRLPHEAPWIHRGRRAWYRLDFGGPKGSPFGHLFGGSSY